MGMPKSTLDDTTYSQLAWSTTYLEGFKVDFDFFCAAESRVPIARTDRNQSTQTLFLNTLGKKYTE